MINIIKINKSIIQKLIILIISFFLAFFSYKKQDIFSEIDNLKPCFFYDLSDGRLYLPSGWNADDIKKWPVTIVLHGFGELSRSLSQRPIWQKTADEFGIVLFFVETGHMGWYENHDSNDTKIIINIMNAFRKENWVKDNGIQLFGWSAGAIMAMGFNVLNHKKLNGKPLFDKLAVISGGFGILMGKELKKNPNLKKSLRIPAFISWGEEEPSDHGRDAAQYLKNLGWQVETMIHPGGHILVDNFVREALLRNSSLQ